MLESNPAPWTLRKAPAGCGGRLIPALVMAVHLFGCGPEGQETALDSSPAFSIPHPALDQMEPSVSEALSSQRERLERLLESPNNSAADLATALGSLGKSYQVHRLVEAAEACFREAHQLDPQHFDWAYYLGVLTSRRGDLEAAAAALQNALALRPDNVPALIRLGNVELEIGAFDRSRERYSKALELDPSAAAAEYGLGRAAAQQGRHEDAVARFLRALELQPQATVIQYHLGQSYRALQRFDLAEAALDDSGPVKVAMADPLMSRINALATASSPFLVQGQAALRDGRLSVASKAFQQAIATDPENPRAYQSLATVLTVVRDFAGAAANLERAVALEPGNPQIHFDLATAYSADDRQERALDHLQTVLELDPRHRQARLALADALAAEGRREDAVGHYRLLLDADPGHAEARTRLATVLAQSGATGQAIAELERAVDDDPNNAEARLNLGIALADRGQLSEAIEEHRRALELATETSVLAQTAYNLGTLHLRSGDPTRALELFRRTLQHDDSSVQAHLNIGNLLAGGGRFAEALPHFERSSELAPNHPTAWLSHATALIHLRRNAEALSMLEAMVSGQPGSVAPAHALARMLAASEPPLRDGPRALAMLTGLPGGGARPLHVETRAMALAATGRFEDALRTQLTLVNAIRTRGGSSQLVRLEGNLDRYASGQACCADPLDVLPLAILPN